MSQNTQKQEVGQAALEFVVHNKIVGVGTGSTVNFFIDALATIKDKIVGAVASSEETARRLQAHNIPVIDLNQIDSIPVYIDGADEITQNGAMIKGGGGALTREKIIASAAEQFICIVDESKLVTTLGKFPLPVEVIPMAQNIVMRQLNALGGQAQLRLKNGAPFITDNGNIILDVHGLSITDPIATEIFINQITGVVTVGLFAKRGATVCLLGSAQGVKKWVC